MSIAKRRSRRFGYDQIRRRSRQFDRRIRSFRFILDENPGVSLSVDQDDAGEDSISAVVGVHAVAEVIIAVLVLLRRRILAEILASAGDELREVESCRRLEKGGSAAASEPLWVLSLSPESKPYLPHP